MNEKQDICFINASNGKHAQEKSPSTEMYITPYNTNHNFKNTAEQNSRRNTFVTRSREMRHMSAMSKFEFSIYNLLVHLKSYILIQTPLLSEIWFQRYEQIYEFLNNVKHKNLSTLLAYNSKSILATSDSFPLVILHFILNHSLSYLNKKHLILEKEYCKTFSKINRFSQFFSRTQHTSEM